jgi:predicted ATPase/DNA-binding SARP family transcriptional activator
MRVGLLGALQIERDGQPVEVSGGRLRALLARLALDAGRPVSIGTLVDAVWDDELPGDEQHALQSLISRLRRSLGDGEAITPAPGGYRLAVEPDAVDAHRFERLATAGSAALRAGDPERASATLGEALALWRGPALADLAGQRFAVTAAAALTDLRLTAIVDRAEAELALGRGAGLVAELQDAAAEHPLHERLAARLIAALFAAGRQADALDAYERVRAQLADELGAAPSPDLQAAHLAVLRGDAVGERRSRRSNLRAPVTSFVGRGAEIERIGALLEQSRLVTLVGPGGAGKTRLAGEALACWVDRVADGVWLVELAPVTAEVEVVPAVLAALGLRDGAVLERTGQAPRDGLERLIDVLADRETILLLDNCEHLIGTAADLADTLLAACPDLRIVATSREPLAIAGESLVPISALADDPAVQLFADRAAAASPGFTVDEHAFEICRRLDGLPLAIELAAARLRSMSVEQLAARLDDRFRLLTGGSRAALPRHRTLRAVVDWSWGLLEEPERRLARRLAVFNAGPTEESAAAVYDESDVLDGLTALVDRSLLQVVAGSDPPRYRMLETIREYALEKLGDAGELEATRTAHARWFAALAERAEPELRGHDQREWFARLQAEHDDMIAALRWFGDAGDARSALRLTVALLWFWMLLGATEEARTWLAFAAAVEGEADPVDRLIAEGIMTVVAVHDGESGDFGDLAGLADTLEELVDARPLLAVALPMLTMFSGDVELMKVRLARALEHPDPWVRATALVMRAHFAENMGDQVHMRADLERAAAGYRDVGDSWGLAVTLSSQAGTLMLIDDLDGAETALDEATELLESLNGSAGAGLLQMRLADIRLRRGDFAAARELALRAVDDGDLQRDESLFVRATIARIAWLSGDLEEFRRWTADAAARLERLKIDRPEQGHARALVETLEAVVALEDGDTTTVDSKLAAAYATAVGTTDMPMIAMVGTVASAIAARFGRAAEAAEILGAAAVLRGAEDRSNPEVSRLIEALRVELGDDGFEAAYGRGHMLSTEAAAARIDTGGGGPPPPPSLGPAPVSP